jgi:hypothetical protein
MQHDDITSPVQLSVFSYQLISLTGVVLKILLLDFRSAKISEAFFADLRKTGLPASVIAPRFRSPELKVWEL